MITYVRGLQEGFRIGIFLRSSKTNMLSATQQFRVMDDYLSKELPLGHFIIAELWFLRATILASGDLSLTPHGQSVNRPSTMLSVLYLCGILQMNMGRETMLFGIMPFIVSLVTLLCFLVTPIRGHMGLEYMKQTILETSIGCICTV